MMTSWTVNGKDMENEIIVGGGETQRDKHNLLLNEMQD